MSRYATASSSFAETLERLGVPERDEGAQRLLGERAALMSAADVVWEGHVGPLCTWRDVAAILGTVTTRQGINDLARRGRLLGLKTKAGQVLYPAFQFHGGRSLPGLPEVLEALSASPASTWTLASWFVTPQDDLDGQTPAVYLRAHGADPRVLHSARAAAERLAA